MWAWLYITIPIIALNSIIKRQLLSSISVAKDYRPTFIQELFLLRRLNKMSRHRSTL